MDLRDFDTAPAADARRTALHWAAVPAWADALVAARPHRTVAALIAAATEAAAGWTAEDLDAALAEHPRIGERTTEPSSAREQGAMAAARDEVAAAVARGNAAYEERFGRVFLVRAAGRTPDELLAELERRLAGDPDTEVAEATAALADIAVHRIRATFGVPHLTTHVLDARTGTPASGVALTLRTPAGEVLATGETDADGRAGLGPDVLPRGDLELRFDTGAHHRAAGTPTFHPYVVVAFTVAGTEHLHVPLLLSPFAYSTYRGS
ncbi:2-oxo-4-hydroxy-4-carboxy-5-ureidoimidazoline decarboxylase [Curtobacterium sp. MCSS17_008]|uniref:2-oxo-4-hydroxy-4-carboxy-5-ureidoimidazoline decarboxylase n=1 Tax=Curtobacterium sp. MCSS17_008 TaxID=2175647 RepID=UPI002694E031|nr:2-oxo-4-hydroxy-4-carboxy-5-ureidoimidazoline decarboxylase [Curtobacterium sp. MCSS17_008]